MADLAALAGQYTRAIDAYEMVALASLNSNLTKWSVKDYYLKSGACYLANNVFLPLAIVILGRYCYKTSHSTLY